MGWVLLGDPDVRGVMIAALAFKNLTLGYDRQAAVLDLKTEIAEGSLTAIIGPNNNQRLIAPFR